ncbi:hypothetical protein ACFU76_18680 [Streptomyces sp. NPDC057539]|uniref:hypothetical protein n=1 Tax=Streptomyces sp. NPDC057539 TaxID=3346159 RepID=UPI0036B05ED0
MTALALTGATTVVAAMATDAWQTTRTGMAVLFRRSGRTQQAAVEAQLEGNAALVAQAEDPERARQALLPVWQLQLEALLRRHPDATDDLRALVDEVRAELPRAEQHWVQTNIARDNGRIFASQQGDVIVHEHPDAGQLRPPTPASPPGTSAGQTS